jgi:hypothetical protein
MQVTSLFVMMTVCFPRKVAYDGRRSSVPFGLMIEFYVVVPDRVFAP